MSLRTDYHFVRTLDTFNDKSWEAPVPTTQLSGWSEEFPQTSERKSLLSAGCSRIKKFLAEHSLFTKYEKTSEKRVKNKNFQKNLKSGPKSYKISPVRRKGYLTRRMQTIPPLDYKDSLNSPQFLPDYKSRITRKNHSVCEEKKHIRLDEYYDKNFVIVQKSPPTVSGYSIVGLYRG